MTNKIRWNETEKYMVCQAAGELLKQDPTLIVTPVRLFDAAQGKVIDPSRRRRVRCTQNIPWFKSFISQCKVIGQNPNATNSLFQSTNESPYPSTGLILDELAKRFSSQLEATIVAALTPIIHSAVDGAMVKYRDALQQAHPPTGDRPLPVLPHPPVDVAPRKRKLLIIGVFSNWTSQLYKEFDRCFQLVIVNSQDAQGGNGWTKKVYTADVVMVLTHYVKHRVIERVEKELMASAKLIRVDGGLSTLRQKIEELFLNGTTTTGTCDYGNQTAPTISNPN